MNTNTNLEPTLRATKRVLRGPDEHGVSQILRQESDLTLSEVAAAGNFALADVAVSSGFSRLARLLFRNSENATILVLGDSTSNDSTDWPLPFITELASQYPAYTATYRLWSSDDVAYAAPTTIQTGSGSFTLAMYNSSVGGYKALSFLAPDFATIVGTCDPDLIIINLGHNEGTDYNRVRASTTALISEVTRRHPRAAIIWIEQNPTTNSNNQAKCFKIISEVATPYGVEMLNVHDVFKSLGDFSTYMSDTVHPNALGFSTLWTPTMLAAFNAAASSIPAKPIGQRPPTGLNLLSNPRFALFDGSAMPDGWVSSNVTVSKDTTFFETGAWAVRIATTTSSTAGFVTRTLPLKVCLGKWVTFAVRMHIDTTLARNATPLPAGVGRVGIYDGSALTSPVTDVAFGLNGFVWRLVSAYIAPSATQVTCYIYANDSSVAAGDITIDRVYASLGVTFTDPIDDDCAYYVNRTAGGNGVAVAYEELQIRRTATDVVLGTLVVGESVERLSIKANGTITAGSGSASHDVTQYRAAVGRWQHDGQLKAADGLQTKYTSSAGKLTAVDGDHTNTPVDGTHVVIRDSTSGRARLAYRANSVWTYCRNAVKSFHTGHWHAWPAGVTSTTTVVDARVYFIPMEVVNPCTISDIGIEVVTTPGGTGSVVRLGIYYDDGTNLPATLLADFGTVDTTTTGLKSITSLAQVLAPGLYWLAAVAQGAPTPSPTLRIITSSNNPEVGAFAHGVGAIGYIQSSVSGALSTASVSNNVGVVPLVSVKFA